MKNPADHLEKWRKFYAERCTRHGGGYEGMPHNCYCETVAQIAVQIECVIPDEYQRYELDDFTGMKDGKRLIKPHIVSEARSSLVSYCWEGIEEGEGYDLKTWWP